MLFINSTLLSSKMNSFLGDTFKKCNISKDENLITFSSFFARNMKIHIVSNSSGNILSSLIILILVFDRLHLVKIVNPNSYASLTADSLLS